MRKDRKSLFSSERTLLLHREHVTSLLDAVRDATLMLCGKASDFTRQYFSSFCDETGKLLYVLERVVHRIERAIGCLIV